MAPPFVPFGPLAPLVRQSDGGDQGCSIMSPGYCFTTACPLGYTMAAVSQSAAALSPPQGAAAGAVIDDTALVVPQLLVEHTLAEHSAMKTPDLEANAQELRSEQQARGAKRRKQEGPCMPCPALCTLLCHAEVDAAVALRRCGGCPGCRRHLG